MKSLMPSRTSCDKVHDNVTYVTLPEQRGVTQQEKSYFIIPHSYLKQKSVLRHILSPLHNLSSATKRAPLTAHFVVPCTHCRPKTTKCVAIHGTFCRPRERERERSIMLLKVIKRSHRNACKSMLKICSKSAFSSTDLTCCAHIVTMLLGV